MMTDLVTEEPKFDAYEETVREVAQHFRLADDQLQGWFSHYLNDSREKLTPEQYAICYAVDRLTKCTSAARISQAGWKRWRQRALDLGWTREHHGLKGKG